MKKLLLLILLTVSLSTPLLAKPYLVTGRMDYAAGIEGGCWFLSAEDGNKYQLIGTEEQMEKLRVIGRLVKLQVDDASNIATTCMMGKTVRIAQVVDAIGFPVDPTYVTVKTSGRVYKTKAGVWYFKTAKGQKYDLDFANIPKAKRRSGARITKQYFKIFMDKTASEHGLDGKATFIADPTVRSRAQEKKPADPR